MLGVIFVDASLSDTLKALNKLLGLIEAFHEHLPRDHFSCIHFIETETPNSKFANALAGLLLGKVAATRGLLPKKMDIISRCPVPRVCAQIILAFWPFIDWHPTKISNNLSGLLSEKDAAMRVSCPIFQALLSLV